MPPDLNTLLSKFLTQLYAGSLSPGSVGDVYFGRISATALGYYTGGTAGAGGTLRVTFGSTALTSTVPVLAPDGTAAAPSYSYLAESDFGWYRSGVRSMHLVGAAGTHLFSVGSSVSLKSDGEFRWSSTAQSNGTADNVLSRVGPGILMASNGAGDFTRLILGTNNTSGAAFVKNGTGVDITDGSNSTFSTLRAGSLTIGNSGGALSLVNPAVIRTAPTISSGFGTSPSVPSSNGTFAFTLNVGTGGTATGGVIALPASTTGWIVTCHNVTSAATLVVAQTAGTTTTATIASYGRTTGTLTAFNASDVLRCTAVAY